MNDDAIVGWLRLSSVRIGAGWMMMCESRDVINNINNNNNNDDDDEDEDDDDEEEDERDAM